MENNEKVASLLETMGQSSKGKMVVDFIKDNNINVVLVENPEHKSAYDIKKNQISLDANLQKFEMMVQLGKIVDHEMMHRFAKKVTEKDASKPFPADITLKNAYDTFPKNPTLKNAVFDKKIDKKNR